MWEPNEQLLLRAPVRYKKHDGTLFVTPRRVAWQLQGSSQLNPSIYYNDIAGLAQTPENSAKVLLKISAKPPAGKDYTFQFTSLKCIQEREAIKSQVTELLARIRGLSSTPVIGTPLPITPSSAIPSPSPSTPQSTSSNINSPASNLQNTNNNNINNNNNNNNNSSQPNNTNTTPKSANTPNSTKSWRQEEFNDRRHLLTTNRELHTLHMELVVVGKNVTEEEFWSSPYVKRIRQKLKKDSVSREGRQKGKSSRMVELKPGQQEGSDIKYTLTSQIIHNIFTEFPSVKRAYDSNVPDKMSEQNFWRRFLASEFFHRSRTGGRSQLAPYDDIFDKCLQEEDDENSKPPSMSRIDKIRFDINLAATQEDHIQSGNAPDFTMTPGREAHALPLIRRFNRHSMRVLETPENKSRVAPVEDDFGKNIIIEDLMNEAPSEKIILDIQDTKRYFESQKGGQDELKIGKEDTQSLLNAYKRKFEGWQPQLTKPIMKNNMADNVCLELTNVIKKKIKHDNKSSTDVKLPPQVQQKIQSYHSATNEILRHFWASFEPYKADKNSRMVESLKSQQQKLKEILITVVSFDGNPEKCKQVIGT
ncbi:hypothetical protein BDB01DRAFT_782937 [Pilobolus umbonatus]|nr:hypothetical protein BDB01DRAFT_782937 [Pilobolus umbonatus]